jgi:hypothetical protein
MARPVIVKLNLPNGNGCTLKKLCSVHFAGLLDVQNILSADIGLSRQIEGHSFGDHLIGWPVSVTPSSVIEASIVLVLCLYVSCESMSNQPALFVALFGGCCSVLSLRYTEHLGDSK